MTFPVADRAEPSGPSSPASPAAPRDVVANFLDNLQHGQLDACCQAFSPDALIHEADSLPFGGSRYGPDGFRALVTAVGQSLKVKPGPPTIDAVGDTVFVRFDIDLKSRRTGRATRMPVVDIYRVAEGAITNLDVFYKDSAEVSELNDPRLPNEESVT